MHKLLNSNEQLKITKYDEWSPNGFLMNNNFLKFVKNLVKPENRDNKYSTMYTKKVIVYQVTLLLCTTIVLKYIIILMNTKIHML